MSGYGAIQRLQALALGWPRTTLLLWLLATLALGAGLPRMQLDASYRSFFRADDPLVVSLDRNRQLYESGDTLLFMVAAGAGDLFGGEGLQAIEALTARSWELPLVLRVDSIGNFPYSWAQGDELYVDELIDDPAALDADARARIRRIATSDPALVGRLVSADGAAAIVVASFSGETAEQLTANQRVYDAALALRDEFRARYPTLDFHVTGTVPGNAAFARAAENDGRLIIPLALCFALLAIFAYLRYESGSLGAAGAGTAASLAVIVVASVAPLGLMAWAGLPANNITSMVPVVILTLAVADSLHLLIVYYQARRRGEDADSGLRTSLRLNTEPVWLTSITTVLGFLALNASESPPFQQFGNLIAFGVAVAWLAANTLLPAMMRLWPGRVGKAAMGLDALMPALADRVIRHRRRLLLTGAAVVLAAIACLPLNRLNEVYTGFLAESTEFTRDTDAVAVHFGEIADIEYSLDSGVPGGIASLDYLRQLAAFTDWLRAQPEVLWVQGVDHTIKRLNRNLHGDDPAWLRLPDSDEEAAQYLLLYEMSLPFGASLTDQITLDRSATRVLVGLRSSQTLPQIALQQRVQDWLSENAPQLWHPGTSMTTIFAHMNRNNAIGMLGGTALAMAVITLVLMLAFGSLRYGLISMLVNALPATVVLGAWGLFNGNLGLSVSMVFAASLGIVVDYSVHFLSKYRRHRLEQPTGEAAEAIRYAFGTVGIALLVTTAVLGINFGLLAFSEFKLNVYLGTLTAATIVLALLTELFFLPPLLQRLAQSGRH